MLMRQDGFLQSAKRASRSIEVRLMAFLVACMAIIAMGGCASVQDMWAPAPPQTKAEYGAWSGFKFYDTKNNDVDLDAQYDPKTGAYSVKAKIRNNASEVNESLVPLMQQFILGLSARVDQMDARTREVEAHGKNIMGALSELRGMIDSGLAPLKGLKTKIDTPIGGAAIETGGGN